MNIKCIALDLDRTTLNASGRLSDGNYNALCHAIENGVHIVIASGRCLKMFLLCLELNMQLLLMVLPFTIFLQAPVFMNIR